MICPPDYYGKVYVSESDLIVVVTRWPVHHVTYILVDVIIAQFRPRLLPHSEKSFQSDPISQEGNGLDTDLVTHEVCPKL